MIDTLVLYIFTYDAYIEPEEGKEEGKEYEDKIELCSTFAAKKGSNSFNAASIAFNQSWLEFYYADPKSKIRYKVVGVHVKKVEEKKSDYNIYVGPALATQLPDTIDELMSCWKSVNPEKDRNVNPKER